MYNDTPLSVACRSGDIETVSSLLKTNINLNQKNKEGKTAFIEACLGLHTPVVKLLLNDERTDINPLCETTWPDMSNVPFFSQLCAKSKENFLKNLKLNSIIRLILTSGRIDLHEKDKQGCTAILYAFRAENWEVLKLLLAYTLAKSNIITSSVENLSKAAKLFLADSDTETPNFRMRITSFTKNGIQTDLSYMLPIIKRFNIAELFCLMVLLCDEYLKLIDAKKLSIKLPEKLIKFIHIIMLLHENMDVHMVIANRCYDSTRDIISPKEVNIALARPFFNFLRTPG